MNSNERTPVSAKFEIRFYAADGSQIGHARTRYAASPESLDEAVENLRRGIDLRTRRQTAGVDSRKVARVEVVEVAR